MSNVINFTNKLCIETALTEMLGRIIKYDDDNDTKTDRTVLMHSDLFELIHPIERVCGLYCEIDDSLKDDPNFYIIKFKNSNIRQSFITLELL